MNPFYQRLSEARSKVEFIRLCLEGAGLDPQALLDRCAFEAHPETGQLELAVSGGADSSALLILGYLHSPVLRVWHMDHGLRPSSREEANGVAALCDALGVDLRIITISLEGGGNLEERARDARRREFLSGVATGHTADDLVETMLINLIRGSGIKGLASMGLGPEHPIVSLRRSDTQAICRAAGIDFVVDESNHDLKFVRNRIRHELVPLLADISGRDVVPILARTTGIMREADRYISSHAGLLDPTDAKMLSRADPLVASEALRIWLRDERGHSISSKLLDEVLRVVKGERVAVDLPGSIRVRRSKGKLSKFPIKDAVDDHGITSPLRGDDKLS